MHVFENPASGYDESFHVDEIFLADDFSEPKTLKSRLGERARRRDQRGNPARPLLISVSLPEILAAFGDTAVIRENRRVGHEPKVR